jgi:hypothetical protein
MLKNNNHKTVRHRGSSPPFQRSDQGLQEWEIGLKSTYQSSDESPYIQLLEQQLEREEESDDQEDDENRWQDDGREIG